MKLPHAQHLSARELAGQLVMPALNLKFINRNTPESRRLFQLIKNYHVSGFILFGGHPSDIRFWTEYLSNESKFPLIFGADLERGLATVFSEGTLFPHQMMYGAAYDPELVRKTAEAIAREARAVGINVIFAPVADLANDSRNPIINIRSWGRDVKQVSDFNREYIKAIQNYGIASVVKHFPGHGDTEFDSHTHLPMIKKTLKDLEKEDLIPFKGAVKDGVKGIMGGHLLVPGLKYPAVMEIELISGKLRSEWQFDGVVFTDSMQMKAITDYYRLWEQIYYPIEAGVDILLMPNNPIFFVHMLEKRIEADPQFRKQAEAAVERIFRLKKWISQNRPGQVHPGRVFKIVSHPDHWGLANEVAENGIVLIRKSKHFPLNLPEVKRVLHFIYPDGETHGHELKHYNLALNELIEKTHVFYNPLKEQISEINVEAGDVFVVSLYFRTYAAHQQTLDWEKITEVIAYLQNVNSPFIINIFGNPFQANRLPDGLKADAIFMIPSYVKVAQLATVKALASFIPINGKLPVTLRRDLNKSLHVPDKPYVLERIKKFAIRKWQPVERFIRDAIEDRIFPGASLLVARDGKILYQNGFGRFDYSEQSPTVQWDTLYDLSGLTRVLATLPAIVKLIEERQIELHNELGDYYPQIKNDVKGTITIGDLLANQSGLPAWKPLFENANNREKLIEEILRIPLEYIPGEKSLNSDLGFILLFDIIEKLIPGKFSDFCRNKIFLPMGLKSLQFKPPRNLKNEIPPTGIGKNGKKIIHGMVSDPLCQVMGGVSGHAGLFGNVLDVVAMGQLFIQKGIYNRQRLFRSSTIEFITHPVNPHNSNRAFGWDTPAVNKSCGKFFSENSIGLNGFTGTSLWIDLQNKIVIAFLSNRIHPEPYNNAILKFRPVLHDLIMKKIF